MDKPTVLLVGEKLILGSVGFGFLMNKYTSVATAAMAIPTQAFLKPSELFALLASW